VRPVRAIQFFKERVPVTRREYQLIASEAAGSRRPSRFARTTRRAFRELSSQDVRQSFRALVPRRRLDRSHSLGTEPNRSRQSVLQLREKPQLGLPGTPSIDKQPCGLFDGRHREVIARLMMPVRRWTIVRGLELARRLSRNRDGRSSSSTPPVDFCKHESSTSTPPNV
jgi:hypothetical protein